MEQNLTHCPNCNTKLNSALFNPIYILGENQTRLINLFRQANASAYCSKCGKDLYEKVLYEYKDEKIKLQKSIEELFGCIPVITLQSPSNWEYEVVDMVTGQSTTGTGVFSEFSSSFNDLLGTQSGSYNRKLRFGENLCKAQLRKQALSLGADAVIGTDIDYSEVGGEKGMLMVCMAGTAVRLKNISILGSEQSRELEHLKKMYDRLRVLNSCKLD
ncbi:heavy metal-binding domain-containing protein [Runella sp. SP2]|uniref:heavy metal-binding domain-containing protein n=1 Tax=Runella sp. SP2 TaxID=2268026 RepID=UPI000F098E2D|nr:heavy metal-binding domain-containing protein [Runella sp. SP2]AYQ31463.1 hypothetical protein DTQ70_04365 [Runella sp. SP2]